MTTNALHFSFNASDTTGRGSLFVFTDKKKSDVYLRAKVANNNLSHAGMARVFLTKLERVEGAGAKSKTTVITDDTLTLNWANSSGADIIFYPSYEHYVDLVNFTLGGKTWKPFTNRTPLYWEHELAKPGIYRLHLLLTGPAIKPVSAIFELKWPIKKLTPGAFSFSVQH